VEEEWENALGPPTRAARARQSLSGYASLKVMRTWPESPLVAFATEMAQDFRFEALVPHEPVPILPLTTLKLNAGKTPVAVIFTGLSVLRSHPACLFEVARHSTTYTWSLGLNPVPHTRTFEPFLRPATGATWNLRGPIFPGGVVVVVVVVGLGSAKVIGVLA